MNYPGEREIIYLQAVMVRGYRRPNWLERLTGRIGPQEMGRGANPVTAGPAKAAEPARLELWVNLLTLAAVGVFIVVMLSWFRH